jgi:hypothetical protein
MRNDREAAPGAGVAGMTRRVAFGLAATLFAGAAWASPDVVQTDLISDGAVPAVQAPDPNLINRSGVSYAPTGPFRVSDDNSGVVTIDHGAGVKQSLSGGTVPRVTVATPPGQTPGTAAPTGQMWDGSGGFSVSETVGATVKTGSSAFIFATLPLTGSAFSPH